jgi:hypothetical protein
MSKQLQHQPDIKQSKYYSDLSRLGREVPDGRSLWLPATKTVVYTTKNQVARHDRVKAILTAAKFSDWSWCYGTNTQPYWRQIAADHAELLSAHKPPLLILEDDIEPEHYRSNIMPPDGCQVAYLGGFRSGVHRGVVAARDAGLQVRTAFGYAWSPVNSDWMRVFGMWGSHAILWLDAAAMADAARRLAEATEPIDTTLGLNQWRWQCYCVYRHLWWQNDGHHIRDTRRYLGKNQNP